MPTTKPTIVTVTAAWDPDASVWVANSDQVPGLVTEADTLELLEQKLQILIPELLEENHVALDPDVRALSVMIIAHREQQIPLRA